ncbi:MAG: MlaD family protein [Candidatus Hydrogenedentes bacterium]|nr:MlaD family protein [Candidatus Hydrogenedentota bacterium]
MATNKHNFTRTEILAGLMVLVSLAVFAGFIIMVENLQTEPPHKTLYARFTNTIGLSDTAIVRFGGLEVGRVVSLTCDMDNQAQILVEIHVEPHVPINESSRATVEQVGLTAEKHLEISTGSRDAALIPDGGTVDVINGGYGFIDIPDVDGLVGGGEELISDLRDFLGVEAAKKAEAAGEEEMASIARISADIRTLLGMKEDLDREAAGGEEAIKITAMLEDLRKLVGVKEAIAEEEAGGEEFTSVADITGDVSGMLSSADGMLNDFKPQIDEILTKVPPMQDAATEVMTGVSKTINGNQENIDSIIANVDGITTTVNEDLDKILEDLGGTLESVKGLSVEAEELLHQNRPAIEDLIGDLGHTVQALNVLLDDLKSQPQSVLFGRPETGRK